MAEEVAVAAGEAAGIGDVAATVDVAAAAVEEDDERGRWAGDTSLSSSDAAAGVCATGRDQGRRYCGGGSGGGGPAATAGAAEGGRSRWSAAVTGAS